MAKVKNNRCVIAEYGQSDEPFFALIVRGNKGFFMDFHLSREN